MKRGWLGLLAAFLLLTGCGFSPIYGSKGGADNATAAALGQVSIENIANREGQVLRNHLIDRFYASGRPTTTTAKLKITITSSVSDLGIQKDATATRVQLNVSAPYKLLDNEGMELAAGTASSIVSYNKLEAQYGNITAQRGAMERALKDISEQITNRVSLYYAEKDPVVP